ncbi:MAG TPA: Lrp/AsnC family transcriptional regulator [Gemmatimonadaceae bacterium]|jgi:Lrp/AsnC family leucine-responsive transcriptional regulator|nr:Lrp/AsnC family transcriptional regulator [Gemmatimonadaceae bacterium]
MIDQTSRVILETLQSDARISNAEIGRRIGLAPSAVFERIKKLEERGAVRGYNANIDPAAVDLGLLAFVLVRADERGGAPRTEAALVAIPEVQEVHHVAGEDCFMLKVRARDTAALNDLLANQIGSLESVRSTKTTIVLRTAKETSTIPIASPELARSREAGDDIR